MTRASLFLFTIRHRRHWPVSHAGPMMLMGFLAAAVAKAGLPHAHMGDGAKAPRQEPYAATRRRKAYDARTTAARFLDSAMPAVI